jgi:hypothetical protein
MSNRPDIKSSCRDNLTRSNWSWNAFVSCQASTRTFLMLHGRWLHFHHHTFVDWTGKPLNNGLGDAKPIPSICYISLALALASASRSVTQLVRSSISANMTSRFLWIQVDYPLLSCDLPSRPPLGGQRVSTCKYRRQPIGAG